MCDQGWLLCCPSPIPIPLDLPDPDASYIVDLLTSIPLPDHLQFLGFCLLLLLSSPSPSDLAAMSYWDKWVVMQTTLALSSSLVYSISILSQSLPVPRWPLCHWRMARCSAPFSPLLWPPLFLGHVSLLVCRLFPLHLPLSHLHISTPCRLLMKLSLPLRPTGRCCIGEWWIPLWIPLIA